MNILAVDTAGKTVGVALLQDDRLLYECYLDAGMTHSETLMPLIDNCLKLCGMGCKDIDLYGVNAGPGSFTGLRIGLAAVKGLAFPRETLCAPVSTLEALAAAHTGCGTVLCALDARRAQVYSAAFDLETHERLMADDARAVADLAEFVENCKKPLFFVGDGAALCYNKYDNVPGVLCVPPALRNGRAAAVAYVAEQMAQRGEAVLPEALLPDYHRLSQAGAGRASGRRSCPYRNTGRYCKGKGSTPMTKPIALAADHGGFELKEAVKAHLDELGLEYIDFGTHSTASVDYPDMALPACDAVVSGQCSKALLFCGTGVGISMAANKIKGIRACCCSDSFSCEYTRRHNDANALCMGGRVVGPGLACQLVDIFLNTEFEGGRHEKRIAKLMEIENR